MSLNRNLWTIRISQHFVLFQQENQKTETDKGHLTTRKEETFHDDIYADNVTGKVTMY